MKNPKWTRDELIIALDFYFDHGDQIPTQETQEIKELSRLLRQYGKRVFGKISEDYRNPNGVFMKLMNFIYHDPTSKTKGLDAGGKLTGIVFKEFYDDRNNLSKTANSICEIIFSNQQIPSSEILEGGEVEGKEGAVLSRMHKFYERNPRLKGKKIEKFKQKHGRVFCEICEFSFETTYGERGKDFIECHHLKPLSTLGPNYRTHIKDLALLCSNCHRMIHRWKPWLSIEELKHLMR